MHKISKTKLKSRLRKKTNPILVETLNAAIRNPKWGEVAKLLSAPTRKQPSRNLFEIDKETKAGDTVILVGKVLSKGELTKKIRICALAISEKAKEKLKATKSEAISIMEEIAKNPKAEGIKVLR
jgi:ribosomal protein L18E